VNPNFAGAEKQVRDVEAAARTLGLQLIVLRASTDREIETAFTTMARHSVGALLVSIDPFFIARRDQIVALALRHTIPAMYLLREFAVAGGLMSYGIDLADAYRQAGIYTGRILRGEKPADLPVQRSTKFEFVINFKTARAYPEGKESEGDSRGCANMIQAGHWAEASMDGTTLFGRPTHPDCRGG